MWGFTVFKFPTLCIVVISHLNQIHAAFKGHVDFEISNGA